MMKQHFSSRLFLTAIIALFACVSIYAQTYLNPFAYRLDNMEPRSGIQGTGNELLMNDHYVIQYALSGPATSVIVRFWNDANSTWSRDGGNTGTALASIDITNETDAAGKPCKDKGYHTYTLDFTDIVGLDDLFRPVENIKLRWTIDVTGGNTPNILEETVNETIDVVTSIKYTNMNSKAYEFDDCDNGGSTVDVLYKTATPISYTRIEAVKVTAPYTFSYPASVDICDDPYNYNFGAVFCTEADALGGDFRERGLFVFGGGMEHLKSRRTDNGTVKEADCYTGPGYNAAQTFSSSAPAPHRVRLTEDGRLFISAMSKENTFLIEYTTPNNSEDKNFYECPATGDVHARFFTGTWSDNILKNGTAFVAGPNCAFDVMGEGSALKLLLLASTIGTNSPEQSGYRIDQYAIGTSNTWSSASNMEQKNNLLYTGNQSDAYTSKKHNHVLNTVHKSAEVMVVAYNYVGMEYDPLGGFWLSQYRTAPAGPLASTMVHRTKDGKWEHEEHALNRKNGAIRHNHNYTKLAVAGGVITDTIMHKVASAGEPLHSTYYNKGGETGKTYTADQLGTEGRAYKCQTARSNQITIYDVAYNNSTGSATLSNPKYINTGNMGSCNDFAWDFADNLYVAARGAGKLVAFALPHAADKVVSTPCRDPYEYKLSPVHEFAYEINPTVAGLTTPYATITHPRINREPYPRYLQNANVTLVADIVSGCKLYKWEENIFDKSTNINSDAADNLTNKCVISSMVEKEKITAHIGLCVYEDTKVLDIEAETTFPAAFVKRELDNANYSTICLPFDLKTLKGTPWEGASVLRMNNVTSSGEGNDKVTTINFIELTFSGNDYMHAYRPYLIKLADAAENISASDEKIFLDAHCPKDNSLNGYGGYTENYLESLGVAFHGVLNPKSELPNDENTLFLVADNRLAKIVGKDKVNILGLRAFFTVNPNIVPGKIQLRLPEKTVTSVPTFSIDTLKPTKYLWNGQIYIQRGNNVYDLSGNCVK